MADGVGPIEVRGLRELQRAFKQADVQVRKEFRAELRALAGPVRALAEEKAVAEISRIGPKWSQMRIGVTTNVVYVAPKSHRSGGSPRPNLAGLLMDRAMQPALDELTPGVETALEAMLDRLGTSNGF